MTRPIRVVHTVDSIAPHTGGPARSVPGLCRALAQDGVDVTLLAREIVAPMRLGAAIRAAAKTHPDLLHDHGVWLPGNHAAATAARRSRVKRVVSPRGMLEPWSLQHRSWKKRLAWSLYQRADMMSAALVHATSDMEARHLRAIGLSAPIAVIPNGVDLPEMPVTRLRGPRRRAVFLSRLHPKKGVLDLVEAWALLRPEGWDLVIAGPDEGGYRAMVESAIRERGVGDSITLAGAVEGEAKSALLHGGDLFVLPTYSENFGIVIAEALAFGLPVITTYGAPWSMLETSRAGWWIPIGIEALVGALASATALARDERDAMGARGRELVRRHFAWASVSGAMIEAYHWVLDGGTPPHCVST